jgi:ribosome-associated heat shock protein Hsp15
MACVDEAATPVRVDKWLWAARLVKTRALAVDAIKGGRVEVNGQGIKPSKEIRSGDRLEIRFGELRRCVIVRGTAQRRGPASEAALLYEETAESREERERLAEQRRLAAPRFDDEAGRPTKRDRRRFEATTGTRRGRR